MVRGGFLASKAIATHTHTHVQLGAILYVYSHSIRWLG